MKGHYVLADPIFSSINTSSVLVDNSLLGALYEIFLSCPLSLPGADCSAYLKNAVANFRVSGLTRQAIGYPIYLLILYMLNAHDWAKFFPFFKTFSYRVPSD